MSRGVSVYNFMNWQHR